MGHTYVVECLDFSPCGKFLASIEHGEWKAKIIIWDVAEG